MRKKYLIGAVIGVTIIGVLTLLHPTPIQRVEQPAILQITTSFYPLYFFTSAIVGDKASVVNITPAGAEPHDYEPTPNDIAMIERSRIVVLNGGGLEAWGDAIRKNINPQKTTVVVAGEGLTTQTVIEDDKKIIDPHVWQSPILAKQMVQKILAAIILADPQNSEYYTEHAAALLSQLDALDQDYRSGLLACTRKDFVTSHAAFGYMASTYGLVQVPIAGISPDTEPSPKQLAGITQFVRDHKITIIFFESLVSPKLSQTIAKETGASTMVLDPIEGLSDEDLRTGRNYLTVMKDNLKNLQTALTCK